MNKDKIKTYVKSLDIYPLIVELRNHNIIDDEWDWFNWEWQVILLILWLNMNIGVNYILHFLQMKNGLQVLPPITLQDGMAYQTII